MYITYKNGTIDHNSLDDSNLLELGFKRIFTRQDGTEYVDYRKDEEDPDNENIIYSITVYQIGVTDPRFNGEEFATFGYEVDRYYKENGLMNHERHQHRGSRGLLYRGSLYSSV